MLFQRDFSSKRPIASCTELITPALNIEPTFLGSKNKNKKMKERQFILICAYFL
jgi:hypothetical protein